MNAQCRLTHLAQQSNLLGKDKDGLDQDLTKLVDGAVPATLLADVKAIYREVQSVDCWSKWYMFLGLEDFAGKNDFEVADMLVKCMNEACRLKMYSPREPPTHVQRFQSAGGSSSGAAASAAQSTPTRAVSAFSGEVIPGKVYVCKLPAGCTETMLKDSFGRCAALRRRRVQRVHNSLSHDSARRFGRIQWANMRTCNDGKPAIAFIQFADAASARAAIEGSVVVGGTKVGVEHSYKKEGEGVARASVSVGRCL